MPDGQSKLTQQDRVDVAENLVDFLSVVPRGASLSGYKGGLQIGLEDLQAARAVIEKRYPRPANAPKNDPYGHITNEDDRNLAISLDRSYQKLTRNRDSGVYDRNISQLGQDRVDTYDDVVKVVGGSPQYRPILQARFDTLGPADPGPRNAQPNQAQPNQASPSPASTPRANRQLTNPSSNLTEQDRIAVCKAIDQGWDKLVEAQGLGSRQPIAKSIEQFRNLQKMMDQRYPPPADSIKDGKRNFDYIKDPDDRKLAMYIDLTQRLLADVDARAAKGDYHFEKERAQLFNVGGGVIHNRRDFQNAMNQVFGTTDLQGRSSTPPPLPAAAPMTAGERQEIFGRYQNLDHALQQYDTLPTQVQKLDYTVGSMVQIAKLIAEKNGVSPEDILAGKGLDKIKNPQELKMVQGINASIAGMKASNSDEAFKAAAMKGRQAIYDAMKESPEFQRDVPELKTYPPPAQGNAQRAGLPSNVTNPTFVPAANQQQVGQQHDRAA